MKQAKYVCCKAVFSVISHTVKRGLARTLSSELIHILLLKIPKVSNI
jgi:hypothetical protein